MPYPTIAPAEALASVAGGLATLVDVRTPAEFEEVHAEGARLVPLDTFSRQAAEAACGSQDGLIYLLCGSGVRAANAADTLTREGRGNVFVVTGGTNAWVSAGLPVIRGRKTLSIERQVRLTVGLLVVTGTALGWFVHPWFYAIPALMGSGLVFAGLTDICGLAIVLAKAPWNRSGGCGG